MSDAALPGRIEGEIAFTEKWATRQGALFYGLTTFKIAASGSIPIILSVLPNAKVWSGILGGLVAITETFTTSYSLKQRFVQKRLECEELKHEKWLYLDRAGIYATAEKPDMLLVERTEEIIQRRIAAWANESPPDRGRARNANHAQS